MHIVDIVAHCSYFGNEANTQIMLAAGTFDVAHCDHIATLLRMPSAADSQNIVRFRSTPEDRKIIEQLQERLGLKTAQVLRVALRRLYEQEFPRDKSGA